MSDRLFFSVCVHVCRVPKSNQMWCKLTSSNVACHGSARQTSLTSLQMGNSLCCIVFHRQSQLSRSLSRACSRSLSVIMNKITPVTDWWNHDGLRGWLQWFILAEHWPFSICGSGVPPHPWPLACVTFPSGYFAKWGLPPRREVDAHNWPEFIFDPRRKFGLGESVHKCFSFSSSWSLRIWAGALSAALTE